MTIHNFPADIYFKHSDTCFPYQLQAGYFISRMDGDILFGLSTSADESIDFYNTMESYYLLILSAGTHFDIPTKETRWKVELMSEAGNTLTLIGKTPTYDSTDEERVNYSRHSWE